MRYALDLSADPPARSSLQPLSTTWEAVGYSVFDRLETDDTIAAEIVNHLYQSGEGAEYVKEIAWLYKTGKLGSLDGGRCR